MEYAAVCTAWVTDNYSVDAFIVVSGLLIYTQCIYCMHFPGLWFMGLSIQNRRERTTASGC